MFIRLDQSIPCNQRKVTDPGDILSASTSHTLEPVFSTGGCVNICHYLGLILLHYPLLNCSLVLDAMPVIMGTVQI
jgi:hypothetical protein